MYDYIFLKLIQAETVEDIEAILLACDFVERKKLSQTQMSQLEILARICQQNIVMRQTAEVNDKTIDLYRELASTYEGVMEQVQVALDLG